MLFVPTGLAPHKQIASDPGADVRLEMVRLAVGDDPRFEASSIEVDRAGTSYTYLTLEQVVDRESRCELYLLVGADAALGLPDWHRPDRIAELARLAVASRDGVDRDRLRTVLEPAGLWERSVWLDLPRLGVSSTMVRSRSEAGMPLRYLVPDPVAELIESNRLYGEGGDRGGASRR